MREAGDPGGDTLELMMRSYDITEWGRPLQERLRENPVPQGSEVLLAVEGCGVCHSDIHIRDGFLDLGEGRKVCFEALGVTLPFTLGHEIVGKVVAVGPDAALALGSRRVVYPWIGCGECRRCLGGDELACERSAGLGIRRAGGFADHVLVPHPRYLLDFGKLDPYVAATCACSGLTAYSALRKLPQYGDSDTLLLIGAGGLGLAALNLARLVTSARIVVADINPTKLAAAEHMGGCEVFDMSEPQPAERLLALVGEGLRGAIDFVGSPATLDFAMKSAGKGATVIVVGLFGGALSLSTALLPSRNLTLRGSYVGTLDEMRDLLGQLQERDVLRVPLARVRLDDINVALEALSAGTARGRFVAVP